MTDWTQVAAWRMERQGLTSRAKPAALLDVVSSLNGVHAQVMSSAELTVWARVDGVTPPDVGTMLWADRSLVKTWAMRGTLHLITAADYPTFQAALSTYDHFLKPAWSKAFGVSPDELAAMIDAIRAVLHDTTMTRTQLAAAVAKRTKNAHLKEALTGNWGSVLKPAAFAGALCFAPSAGRNVSFTNPETWLGVREFDGDGDAAKAEVVLRHLGVAGPATREDVARWWGGSAARAGRVIKALGERVTPVELDGTTAYVPADDLASLGAATPRRHVRLVPAFDQYVIAASNHAGKLLPDPSLRARVYRQAGWLSPTLIVNGRMEGVWSHERKGKTVTVSIEPFREQPAWVTKGAEAEAERLAAYLGGTLTLR